MDTHDISEQFSGDGEGQNVARSTDPIVDTTSMGHGAKAHEDRKDVRQPGETETPPRAKRPRKSARSKAAGRKEPPTAEMLTSLGFTADEVAALLDVTVRAANSAEVREEQAIMRRLHFQRWLIDHGRLNEYATNDVPTLDDLVRLTDALDTPETLETLDEDESFGTDQQSA